MISYYLFFNSDDPEAEPLTDRDGKVIRESNLKDALMTATQIMWGVYRFPSSNFVHIIEDDGESIAPVLTVKRYEPEM